MKTTILIFSVPKYKCDEEEENSVTAKAYLKSHFVNVIRKEPTARLSGKLSCNWLILIWAMLI